MHLNRIAVVGVSAAFVPSEGRKERVFFLPRKLKRELSLVEMLDLQ